MTPHELGMLPKGTQVAMAGDDWTSDHERKLQRRLEAAREKAGQSCAAKLEAAADALNAYLSACNACRDGSGDERTSLADSRTRLIGDLMEYAGFLNSKHRSRSNG